MNYRMVKAVRTLMDAEMPGIASDGDAREVLRYLGTDPKLSDVVAEVNSWAFEQAPRSPAELREFEG